MTHSRIHTNVMRRVHIIRTLRPFTTTTALAAFAVLLSLYEIGRQVWVARVIENIAFATDIATFARFVISAFVHTDFLVQSLVLLATAAFVWLVRDGVRNLRYLHQMA